MIRKTLSLLALGLIAMASSTATAATTAVSTFVMNATEPSNGQTLGFDFTATTPITVTSLGAYYSATNNILPGSTIFLFDTTNNTLLASQAFPTTGLVNNAFNYGPATLSVTLNTTDVYSVFTVYAANYAYGTVALSSDLRNVLPNGQPNGMTGLAGTGPVPPTGPFTIISTSFLYTPVVPEPASFGMMGLGLVGAALIRRKMAKRTA